MKQYAVTGIGIINGLGSTLQENWENLLAGRTAIKEITWPNDDPTKFPKTHRALTVTSGAPCPLPSFEQGEFGGHFQYWDPCVKIAMSSVRDAVKDSGLTSKNVSVVYSSVGGSLHSRGYLTRNLEDGRERILPRQVIQSSLDYISGVIARYYGCNGGSVAMNSACSTGLVSIDYGIKQLAADSDLDAVIVGGADMPLEGYQSYYFQNLGALSSGSAETASKPFDKNRTGFVAGEAAGALVIEPLEKAQIRGAKIYGIIRAVATASAGSHDTTPDKNGEAARSAVIKAVKHAGLLLTDIGYINAHATGTIAGDDIEFYAMRDLFPNAVMTANKGQIGHTLAASGIVEIIYTLLALRDQMTPPTANLINPIDTGINIPTKATAITAKYAIKNNFAFGGRAACAVVERYED
jgi:3-oxoacyl-[acyl-carrier-protein] synthase II